MLARVTKLTLKFGISWTRVGVRGIHNSRPHYIQKDFKISVLGASGSVGRPLSLLLKHSELISELYLYDVNDAEGIACDLDHIETRASVRGYVGSSSLRESLKGSDIVLMAAGSSWHSNLSQVDLFEKNVPIVKDLAEACAEVCPEALIAVITTPVDALVPVISNIFKRYGVYDPRKIFGVSTLHVVRTNTFIARHNHLNPLAVNCPVIGGNFGETVIPVISKCRPKLFRNEMSDEDRKNITSQVQGASKEVEDANVGKGTATLSMAYAGARFANSLLKGLSGDLDVVECTFVKSDIQDTKYFSSQVQINEEGVERILHLPKLTDYEQELLQKAIPRIHEIVELGEAYKSF